MKMSTLTQTPAHRVADELEALGLTVDRTKLLDNELKAATDDEMLWMHIPSPSPHHNTVYTRALAPGETRADMDSISTLSVGTNEAEPMTELAGDIVNLFDTLDILAEAAEEAAA